LTSRNKLLLVDRVANCSARVLHNHLRGGTPGSSEVPQRNHTPSFSLDRESDASSPYQSLTSPRAPQEAPFLRCCAYISTVSPSNAVSFFIGIVRTCQIHEQLGADQIYPLETIKDSITGPRLLAPFIATDLEYLEIDTSMRGLSRPMSNQPRPGAIFASTQASARRISPDKER